MTLDTNDAFNLVQFVKYIVDSYVDTTATIDESTEGSHVIEGTLVTHSRRWCATLATSTYVSLELISKRVDGNKWIEKQGVGRSSSSLSMYILIPIGVDLHHFSNSVYEWYCNDDSRRQLLYTKNVEHFPYTLPSMFICYIMAFSCLIKMLTTWFLNIYI